MVKYLEKIMFGTSHRAHALFSIGLLIALIVMGIIVGIASEVDRVTFVFWIAAVVITAISVVGNWACHMRGSSQQDS